MKIVFMGTPAAAVPCLKRLVEDGHEVLAVYCQPDRPSGRGQKLTPPPVKIAAEELGLTVRQPEKIKTEQAVEEFRALGADVAVVVAYGRILPKEFLNAFHHGAMNIHFSLLPKYRGAAPVNWAIVNGETETGVCSMKMDEGLDTGDLLIVEKSLAALPLLAQPIPRREMVMSVNLSGILLEDVELRHRLLALIDDNPCPPGWTLQVELVEDSFQDTTAVFDDFLRALVARNVCIAIDDFGTGYSSLARLISLPILAYS